MFGKKTKNHFGIKILIAFLVSIIPTYLVSTLGVMYLNKNENKPSINEYSDYLSNYNLVIDRTLDLFPVYTPLLLMGLFTFGICYLIQGILFEDKGYEEADDVGIHGTSKWGDPDELRNGKTLAKKSQSNYSKNLKKNLSMENGYILGKVPEKNGLTIMHDNTDVDNQNVVVLGSSGAGKTQSYVIPNLINVRNKSIIVTDPKGELFELTAQLKRDQGYKTYQVDFVHFKQAKYNPLYYVETALDAQKIANTIITNFEKGGEGGSGQFFKNSATNILSALIVYVKTEYDKEEANLEKVVDVYDEHVQDEEHFLKWVDTIPKTHPAKDLLNSIKELTDVTRKSVTSTLSNGFSLFKLPEVKSMTQTSDFDFEDFIEEKAILYVKLSMEDNTFAPLTSVFFNQMLNIYYQIAQESHDNKLKRKVVFMLDEFANIGKLDNYSRVLATCRSLGLSMHTIIQNKAQLEDRKMYGKDESAAIFSNHDTTILLRAKDTDTVTTKWFSEALGDTTISQKKNDMTKSKSGVSKQIGDNYLKRPLMTPAEIAGLSKKECIVLISGRNPLFLDKAFQGEVYPDLITKKVKENGKIKFKYNYDNIRESLGYTDPVAKEENYNVEKQVTFSEIRDMKKQKDDEYNETKKHESKQEDNNQSSDNESKEENDNKKYKFNKSFESVLNKTGMKSELNQVSKSIAEDYKNGDDSLANLLKETKDNLIEHANEDDEDPFNELEEEEKDITVEQTTKESVNKFKKQAIGSSNDMDLPM